MPSSHGSDRPLRFLGLVLSCSENLQLNYFFCPLALPLCLVVIEILKGMRAPGRSFDLGVGVSISALIAGTRTSVNSCF